MKRILVIDGNSIINRAFYGVRPLTTKSGKPTNAIYGMLGIIQKQLDADKITALEAYMKASDKNRFVKQMEAERAAEEAAAKAKAEAAAQAAANLG